MAASNPSPSTSRTGIARLDRARSAFQSARLQDAARELDAILAAGSAPLEAILLRARIFTRSSPADALALLASHGRAFSSNAEQARIALAQGVAFARLGDAPSAEAKFERGERLAARDAAFATELAYQRAGAAWIARDLDAAETLSKRVAETAIGDLALENGILAGAIAASRGNLASQGAILLDALDRAQSRPESGILHRATIAAQIAYLARELPSQSLRDAAYAQVETIPWTTEIADLRFTMLRAVAFRHALDGDTFNAFRTLKRAVEIAPSDGWRVMSSADRAYLADALGEPRWAEQELSDAHELASRVPWATLDGEERFALSLLAERFAHRDPALALAYVARYQETGKRFSRALASAADRRVQAMESYSFGVVQAALGEESEARRLLERSYRIYDSIGFAWRAARAALALGNLPGGASWNARASELLAAYPNSWLARPQPVAQPQQPPEIAELTATQRTVYDLLLQGLATSEIAARQGRSEFTVRNHIKAILKTFNVNSRPALLAKAGRARSL